MASHLSIVWAVVRMFIVVHVRVSLFGVACAYHVSAARLLYGGRLSLSVQLRGLQRSSPSKPLVNDFSYTALRSSCLYRIRSSSWPKSAAGDDASGACDNIGGAIAMVWDRDEAFRAATPHGLARRRSGEKSRPEADGTAAAARTATATTVARRRFMVAGRCDGDGLR